MKTQADRERKRGKARNKDRLTKGGRARGRESGSNGKDIQVRQA